MPQKLNLSNISLDDLVDIHNQVLQQVAAVTKANIGGGLASEPHDSHSSNHSNNKIVDRPTLQDQLAQTAGRG
jgi:hypothetical protein